MTQNEKPLRSVGWYLTSGCLSRSAADKSRVELKNGQASYLEPFIKKGQAPSLLRRLFIIDRRFRAGAVGDCTGQRGGQNRMSAQ